MGLRSVGEPGEKRLVTGPNSMHLARRIHDLCPGSGLQAGGSARELVALGQQVEVDLPNVLARTAVDEHQEPRCRESEVVERVRRQQFDLGRDLLSLHIREVPQRRNRQLRDEQQVNRFEPGHGMMKREYVPSLRNPPDRKRSTRAPERLTNDEPGESRPPITKRGSTNQSTQIVTACYRRVCRSDSSNVPVAAPAKSR